MTKLETGEKKDDEDEDVAQLRSGGPYVPYHDGRHAELFNPLKPTRPSDCPLN